MYVDNLLFVSEFCC